VDRPGAARVAAGERIFEILDEPEEIADRPRAVQLEAGPGHVAFEDVTFGYDLPVVLEGITLEIPGGRPVALIGPTGSGKTTLAALVPRFYAATAGQVLVDGVDVRDLAHRSLRREIGVISQDPFLFSASIRDNIALGIPDAPLEAIEAAAQAAQAHDFILELPRYDTVVGTGDHAREDSGSGSRSLRPAIGPRTIRRRHRVRRRDDRGRIRDGLRW
jgi:ABC-type multidrug transport system fused ATPase/permease subunit